MRIAARESPSQVTHRSAVTMHASDRFDRRAPRRIPPKPRVAVEIGSNERAASDPELADADRPVERCHAYLGCVASADGKSVRHRGSNAGVADSEILAVPLHLTRRVDRLAYGDTL